MHIAYADNDSAMLRLLEKALRDYCDRNGEALTLSLFTDPGVLLASMEHCEYDLVILSVRFPEQGLAGLEVSRQMRRYNPYVPSLFVSPLLADGTLELDFVHPRRLVLRPFTNENFLSAMDSVFVQILNPPLCTLEVMTVDKEVRQLSVSEIVYAESHAKEVHVHLYSGGLVRIRSTMKEFVAKTEAFHEFLYPHKSFVVNAVYVSKITAAALTLKTGDVPIPIARGKAQSVKEGYLAFFERVLERGKAEILC